ncbi:zinc finger protein 354A-like isoform X2 [Pectinophora gossypiella]|uniref:zinc finger protein 354A-like isoform X2 n=1 Tax=Pectinophora gossypiella TaxID=13191 RepID=UPI00214EF025|nr:zinc finger protein 354A-like isoform X2 [Pectinophora gossypiella]
MEEVRVCRICLVMGVKLFDLQAFPWTTYLEPVVGVNPLSAMDLPPYACFECGTLLKKYYLFRERCMLGQSLLYGILQTDGKITPEEIKRLNRQDLNLISPLQLQSIPEETIINITYDETQQEIKHEPDDVQEDFNFKVDYVKEEDSCDEFPLGALSSDDNEPLSLHRTIKENKTKEKKKVKRGRKIKDEAADEQLKLEPTDAPPKPKRGRPRKTKIEGEASASETAKKPRRSRIATADHDDIDLEEYCTIIKLSAEEQLEEISKRQQSSNYLNAPFQCNLCYKGFIDTHAWRHHVGKHDPSAGDIECPVCKFRFKTKRTLQKHAANHEKKYACKSCSYVSKTTTQAKQHQRWHKGVTYKCQYCDEVSMKWTSYLSHVRIKHPSEFICGICGYSFVSRLGLTMHRTMMHKQHAEGTEESNSPPGPYCAQCDVQFQSLEAYKRHMVTSVKHTQSNDFTTGCRVCGSTFPSAEELRLHHRKEHARKRPKNYGKKPSSITWPAHCEHDRSEESIEPMGPYCAQCDIKFKSQEGYKRHTFRSVKHSQNNLTCRICGSTFTLVKDLRSHHLLEHPGQRLKHSKKPPKKTWPAKCEHCEVEVPNAREYFNHFRRAHPDKSYPIQKNYVCDICGKSFRGNAFLAYHKRTHFDERAYKCTVCPKAFHTREKLQNHKRMHSDARPYSCDICSQTFKCKGNLNRHVRSHTGIKPYECEVCGKGFTQSNSRKLHVRTVHLKQPAPYVSRARLERRRGTTREEAAVDILASASP